VDLDAVFSARDRTRLFWDTMHPSDRGQVLVADTLAGEVRRFVK
jgi:lysophospholipase L1-like esterase